MARPANDGGHPEAALGDGAFRLPEWRHPAIRPGKGFGAVVSTKDDDGVIRFTHVVQLRHPRFFKAIVGFGVHHGFVLWREKRPDVHTSRVMPNEEWLAFRLSFLHELDRAIDQHLIKRCHVVLGRNRMLLSAPINRASGVWTGRKRAFIHDLLFADLSPAWLDGSIHAVCGPAVSKISWEDFVPYGWVRRIRIPEGIRHCVEVVQITEILIEPMYARKKLIPITKMVFPKLAGGVAHRFECSSDGRGFRRKTHVGASLPYGSHACSDGQFARDEVRSARSAACFGVVVCEQHTLRG